MNTSITSLLESDLIGDEAKQQIQSAWNNKLKEAREQLASEIRSEFAGRFEHDRDRMVSALENMVQETLTTEISRLSEERNALASDRAKFVKSMRERANTIREFVKKTMASEIKEFRNDNRSRDREVKTLREFVQRQLAKELTEFGQDKRALVETRVKLIKESKTELKRLKKQFVERSSAALREAVQRQLRTEIRQLKEDITVARENNFGRKMFEAFASEFSNSYLNENVEIKKLKRRIKESASKIQAHETRVTELSEAIQKKDREVKVIKERAERSRVMSSLLKPLRAEKADVMKSLLESVPTSKLEAAFNRYLPAVTNGKSIDRRKLNESSVSTRTARTGDRKTKIVEDSSNRHDTDELKLLAGVKSN